MKRLVAIIMSLTVLAITALAQDSAQPKTTTPAPSTPTQELDEKEFELRWKAETKARRIPDPNKRIEALQKMLTDFPNDPPVLEVEQGILDTYLEFWPQQIGKILPQIDKVIGPVRPNQKVGSGNNLFNELAVKLVKREYCWIKQKTSRSRASLCSMSRSSISRRSDCSAFLKKLYLALRIWRKGSALSARRF